MAWRLQVFQISREIIVQMKSARTIESLEVRNAVSFHSTDGRRSTLKPIASDGKVHVGGVQCVSVHARVSQPDGGHILRLAVLLAFPVIGLEQLLHADRAGLAVVPLLQALHWLSDSLLALPLAAVAVWGGQRLAVKLGLGESALSSIVGRACLIAILFALVLVPGAALHDFADRLTHVHASLPSHSHLPRPAKSAGGVAVMARFVGHALSDGVVGQAIGLPLLVLALAWEGRKQRQRDAAAATPIEEA